MSGRDGASQSNGFLARVCFMLCGLRVRLLVLLILSGLPMFSLIVVTAVEQRSSAKAAAEKDALQVARMVAERQLNHIDEGRSLLSVLEHVPDLERLDPAACSALLADIVGETPVYLNLSLINPNGDTVCAARPDVTASVADRPFFQEVRRTRQFVVSDYILGRVSRRPGLVLAQPRTDAAGDLTSVLILGLELTWMSTLMDATGLPSESTFTMVDRQGSIIVRHPIDLSLIGQPLPANAAMRSVPGNQPEGTLLGKGLEGDDRIYAYTSITFPNSERNSLAFVSIPTRIAFAEPDRQLARNLTGLGVTGALAFVAVWFGGDLLLVRAVRRLVRASLRITDGDLGTRVGAVPDGGSEIVLLGRAFDQMAASLERREEERKRLMADLEHVLARRTALFNAVTQNAEAATTTEGVYSWLIDASRMLIGADEAWAACWDEAQRQFTTVATTSPDIAAKESFALGDCLGGAAAHQRAAVIDNDIHAGHGICMTAFRAGMRAAVAVPLVHNEQLLGTLVLATRRPDGKFTEEDGRDLEILGAYGASRLLAVERTQLFAAEATARELTHLINNDLALAVAPLDLMREDAPAGSEQRAVLDGALAQIGVATARLVQLNRLVRFRTKQTPVGASLDLGASAGGAFPPRPVAPAPAVAQEDGRPAPQRG